MSTQISYSEAKNLTIQYLNWWMGTLPLAHRTAPVIPFDNQVYTVPEMIAQVNADSYVGQRYVNYYIRSLGQYAIVE